MSESLANYGTVVSQQYFGRVFFSNEADTQALEILHKQQGTISVATEGEIKLGSMSAGKFTSIKQGTLSTSYASISTITDGTATIKAGLGTGFLSLTSTTLTDGTAKLEAGTMSGLLKLTSNTITDGTTVMQNGTATDLLSLTSTILTDGTASLTAGKATELVTVNSASATITTARITNVEDGTATLSSGSLTGAVFVSTSTLSATIGSISKVFRASTITDNVASLSAGTFSGLLHLTSNTITDGTLTLKAGSVSGVLHLTSNTITDGTATIKAGLGSGFLSVTSTTLTDGTTVMQNGTATGLLSLTSTILTDGTASLTAGKATELVTVNSTNATITSVEVTKIADKVSTLTGGSLTSLKRLGVSTDSPLFSLDAGSVTDAIKIPVGTTAQRPTLGTGNTLSDADRGLIRYNSTTGEFEGYYGASKSWASLGGGLEDDDGDTKITVDTNNGDTDTITFTTAGTNRLLIEADGDIVVQNNTTLTSGNLSLINGSVSGGLYLASNTITDGTATIKAGLGTGFLSLTSSTLTDGTAKLEAGTMSGLLKLTSNTITDGTTVMQNGTATDLLSLTSTILTDGTASLTAGKATELVTVNSASATITTARITNVEDGTATLSSGSLTGSVFVSTSTLSATIGSISKVFRASTITDNVASLSSGTFSGLLHLTSNTITDGTTVMQNGTATGLLSLTSTILTDGVASLTTGKATDLVTVNSTNATITTVKVTTLQDGTATLSGGSITNLKLAETDVASVTSSAFIEKLTDGGLTMQNGSLTGGANTWVSAAVGSFTDLYANDLFVADDLVLNGSTSVVNSTQVAFEDKLLSLGVSSGRDVTDRTNAVLTLTGDLTAYATNVYVLLMNTADGAQGIFQVSSKNGQEVTLTTTPNGATFASGANPGLYVGVLGDISNATNAGIEIMGYTGAGTDAAKRLRYIHDATKPAFEFTSENTALDVRVKNTNSTVSYFSVNNGSASKRLLTEDALFLNTASGTITGSSDEAAIYLSKNADADDASGDWRMLIDSNGKFSLQKYSGSAWNSKWQVA